MRPLPAPAVFSSSSLLYSSPSSNQFSCPFSCLFNSYLNSFLNNLKIIYKSTSYCIGLCLISLRAISLTQSRK